MPWWVTLSDDSAFCLVVDYDKIKKLMNQHKTQDPKTKIDKLDFASYKEALDKFLLKAASQYGMVRSIQTLPYAANPVKSDVKGQEVHEWTLCFDPRNCAGKSSCPRHRSCSE